MSVITFVLILIIILALCGNAPIKSLGMWGSVVVAFSALILLIIQFVH